MVKYNHMVNLTTSWTTGPWMQTTRLATAVKFRAVEASVLRLYLFCSIY